MKKQEILGAIKMLAKSQGSYGRLYENLMALSSKERCKVLQSLENQNFKDVVDMIMFLEG